MKAIIDAYEEYDPKLINFTWLQLQFVMLEILKVKGGNNYRNPHKGKKKLDRIGELPVAIPVDQFLIDEIASYLNEGMVNINMTLNGGVREDEVEGYELLD